MSSQALSPQKPSIGAWPGLKLGLKAQAMAFILIPIPVTSTYPQPWVRVFACVEIFIHAGIPVVDIPAGIVSLRAHVKMNGNSTTMSHFHSFLLVVTRTKVGG